MLIPKSFNVILIQKHEFLALAKIENVKQKSEDFVILLIQIFILSQSKTNLQAVLFRPETLLGNPKGPIEVGNPNTALMLCLFLFISAQKIICRKNEVFLIQLILAKIQLIPRKPLSGDRQKLCFIYPSVLNWSPCDTCDSQKMPRV